MIEVLANAMMVIKLQQINVSDQHVVPLNLIECYMSIISRLTEKERGHAEKFGFGSKNISESLDGFKLRRNTDFRV